jgi:sporulation protein YlmC with PRC-barrel domain
MPYEITSLAVDTIHYKKVQRIKTSIIINPPRQPRMGIKQLGI